MPSCDERLCRAQQKQEILLWREPPRIEQTRTMFLAKSISANCEKAREIRRDHRLHRHLFGCMSRREETAPREFPVNLNALGAAEHAPADHCEERMRPVAAQPVWVVHVRSENADHHWQLEGPAQQSRSESIEKWI